MFARALVRVKQTTTARHVFVLLEMKLYISVLI